MRLSSPSYATIVAVVCDDDAEGRRAAEEVQRFRDFLPTKNGCMVFSLAGHDNAGDPGDPARGRLPYTAAQARRDALEVRGKVVADKMTPEEQARMEILGILVDELGSIREAAASGRTSVAADPRHVASGVWPYARQAIELLGFSVRNVINSRMERQGATIFWDEE